VAETSARCVVLAFAAALRLLTPERRRQARDRAAG
jgi:hypothetical protein